MSISQKEFDAYIKFSNRLYAKSIKKAFREGLFVGVKKSSLTDLEVSDLWDASHAQQTLIDEDLTIPNEFL